MTRAGPAAAPRTPSRGVAVSAALVLTLLAGCTGVPDDDRSPSGTTSPPAAGPDAYTEQWRPQFHYSPPEGRLADPNGLVWFEGEWHLFHQQDGTWAHAVSTDLVHWETLPTALEHDELGQALSGSAVVDGGNTSGLFPEGEGGLVAVYTSTEGGEAQSVAYSTDRGRTWERFAGNPVIPNDGRTDFRDPKVFWHDPTSRWVMVVSVGGVVELHGSPDLLDWEPLSTFGEGQGLHSAVWECPDLFPLPVDGNPDDTRWVLTVSVGASEETAGSTAQYFVGDFDGTTFVRDPTTPPETVQVTDVGQDFYAAQTFENAPDGRRLWMGWMGDWRFPYAAPTAPWQNAMSVPRELSLRRVDPGAAAPSGEVLADGGYVLAQAPVPELEVLDEETTTVTDLAVEDGDVVLDSPGGTFEVLAEIDVGDAEEVGLRVRERRGEDGSVAEATVVGVGPDGFFLDRTQGGVTTLLDRSGADADFGVRRTAAYAPVDGVVRLRVLVDESSVEAFADDGALTGTLVVYPGEGTDGLSVYARGGTATVRSIEVTRLASIWR
ncbi:glycoside hydrolase family 32 protein [Oerskovia flava]|uniref:glycoside hydrolase family 32 protein n=1 Tax=Oerskovia flava TaxID=2986422 RepID=UPI00223EDB10|nr:glycoside hydrolase family 32 protein [Oerskovia sp. JB1-3-2]